MTASLATSTVTCRLSNEPGRALVNARGQHFVIDSPPPLGGPNEAPNPAEILLAALGTCAAFVCERAAQEKGIPLESVNVVVAGDFDPRGICGEAVDPRFQAFRVRISLHGPDSNQREALVAAFKTRCPVYSTLAKIASIEIALA